MPALEATKQADLELGEGPTLMKDTGVLLFYALAFVTSLSFTVDDFVMITGRRGWLSPLVKNCCRV